MADFKGYIANCLIGCDEVTRTDDGGWIRNRMNLELGGFRLKLIQRKDVISGSPSKFQNQRVHTTDVIVSDVTESQIPPLEEVLKNLSWLLSLAGLSPVRYYGYEFPFGTGNGHTSAMHEGANWFLPIVPIRDGESVKEFLNQVYAPFCRLRKERRLQEIIHYLLEAERTPVMEVKLLILFVTLEGLKDTYAKTSDIPYRRGYFWKTRKSKKRADRYSFEQLLRKMLRDGGMRRGLKRVVSLRNEIIHSGISRLPYSSLEATYERVHDIVREYLLRLLGYEGSYYSSSTKIRCIGGR